MALFDMLATRDLMSIIAGAILIYTATRCIYLLYFHPLSKFPGPPIAAVSNIWYSYHWLSGRYPWAIEDVLRGYGDVVRIAPNELVFLTPQATIDIYSPHKNHLEVFLKTDFNNRGKDLGGTIWEEDPVLHRQIAKKVAPAFSNRSLRAMEPVVHKYIDYFVSRMKELGAADEGVGLVEWTNWLAMDLSSDLTWNVKMHQMRDLKNTPHLNLLLNFNKFTTIIQIFKRFPLLSPLKYLFVPFSKINLFFTMEKNTRSAVLDRLQNRGKTEHVDFFEYILPADEPIPTDPKVLMNLGSVAVQIMFAGFGPMADWFYGTLFYLLEDEDEGCYRILTEEIRNAFNRYEDIRPEALMSLSYLQACLEGLRMMPSNCTGLPRISPGAVVDGLDIPKGTYIQTSLFALSRHPKYFHSPHHFKPQRWLPPTHPLYDPKFSDDNLKRLFSFSLGPRVCVGKEMAWMQGRLFLAKVLWMFDVVRIPGQRCDLEGEMRHFGFWEKPELRIKFIEVNREGK